MNFKAVWKVDDKVLISDKTYTLADPIASGGNTMTQTFKLYSSYDTNLYTGYSICGKVTGFQYVNGASSGGSIQFHAQEKSQHSTKSLSTNGEELTWKNSYQSIEILYYGYIKGNVYIKYLTLVGKVLG